MTDFGLDHARFRRARLFDIRLTPCELDVFIGGVVLVGFIGAMSGSGLTF